MRKSFLFEMHDDTAVLATGERGQEKLNKKTILKLYVCTSKWRVQLNETKSTRVNFTRVTKDCPSN